MDDSNMDSKDIGKCGNDIPDIPESTTDENPTEVMGLSQISYPPALATETDLLDLNLSNRFTAFMLAAQRAEKSVPMANQSATNSDNKQIARQIVRLRRNNNFGIFKSDSLLKHSSNPIKDTKIRCRPSQLCDYGDKDNRNSGNWLLVDQNNNGNYARFPRGSKEDEKMPGSSTVWSLDQYFNYLRLRQTTDAEMSHINKLYDSLKSKK